MSRRSWILSLLAIAVGHHVREAAAQYAKKLSYMEDGKFFDHWNFITTPDPTHGDVEYVSYADATAAGLVNTTRDRTYIGADMKSKAEGPGRRSVRIESKKVFNDGLFIFSLDHMPTGCGTWYAFWMFGEDAEHPWPQWGEFDVIEGYNEGRSNVATSLHTTHGCDQSTLSSVEWQTGQTKPANNCDVGAPGQWANQGCGQSGPTGSIGPSFNRQKGGTYAAEWDPDGRREAPGMRVWYWPAGQEPEDLLRQKPDPSSWGAPYSHFSLATEVCPSRHFMNMRLVIDITFCGDLGNPTYGELCPEIAKEHSCRDFVMNYPEAFSEAYWSIRVLDVYSIGVLSTDHSWIFIVLALACLGWLLYTLRNRLESGSKASFDSYSGEMARRFRN